MLVDYFTKPLQRKLLELFREIIMGWKHISVLLDKIPIKEHVEDQDQIVSEIESSRTDDVVSKI